MLPAMAGPTSPGEHCSPGSRSKPKHSGPLPNSNAALLVLECMLNSSVASNHVYLQHHC